MITKSSCNIQFDRIHIRGSSHGASRITRKAYSQRHYVNVMLLTILSYFSSAHVQ